MKKVSELTIKTLPNKGNSKKFLGNLKDTNEKTKFIHVANSRSGHNFIKDNVLSWLNTNFEDIEYRNLENYNLGRFENEISVLSEAIYDDSIKIMTVRDLLNWFTSYYYLFKGMIPESVFMLDDETELSTRVINPINENYRLIHFGNPQIKKFYLQRYITKETKLKNQVKLGLDTWLINAKEFKGDTNILSGFTKISYDQFFIDKDYRKVICAQLNGTYNEEKLNIIPPQGSYSTFDNTTFQDKGQEMLGVLERYKKWDKNDKEYLDILFKHDAFQYYIDNFILDEEKILFISQNKN